MVANGRSNDDRKLFVRQLDFNTTETTVQEYFSQFGHVSEIIMKYNESGRSKGFCFVVFNEKEVMEEVLKSEHEIDGRKVQIKKAGDTGGDNQTNKMFCGGLPHAVTEDDLRTYFSQYGDIASFEFVYDKTTEERKHFCFILFQDPSSVEKIVEGKLPPGSVIHYIGTYRVECKKKFEDNHPIQKKVKYATNQKKATSEDWSYGGGYDAGYSAPRAAPRRARGGVRGRARGSRGAPRGAVRGGRGSRGAARGAPSHVAYPGYSAGYEDPYAASYEDHYAEDPYAADPYAADPYAADPYAADPYAADPYAADPYAEYATDESAYSSYAGYEHAAPRAGGGPMKSRGGAARGGAARGATRGARGAARGARARGTYPAPY